MLLEKTVQVFPTLGPRLGAFKHLTLNPEPSTANMTAGAASAIFHRAARVGKRGKEGKAKGKSKEELEAEAEEK